MPSDAKIEPNTAALRHLIADHHRAQEGLPRNVPPEVLAGAVEAPPRPDPDEQFQIVWRDELIGRAWDALADFERRTGQPLFTVLHFLTDHPEMSREQMAEQLAGRLGKEVPAAWVRKRLSQARDKLKDLIVQEVVQSLEKPTREAVEDELLELGLLDRCGPALQRNFPAQGGERA